MLLLPPRPRQTLNPVTQCGVELANDAEQGKLAR